jgi:hypothetical protein
MAFDTYDNLQTAIGSFLNRTDLAANIPDFITLAEAQITRRINKARNDGQMLPRDMVFRNPAFDIPASTEFVNLPADFLGPLSFYLDPQSINGNTYGAVQLDYLAPENLEYLKQKRGITAVNATPGVYSIVGSQIQLLPIPDQDYTANLFYWQKLQALSEANPSNWILAKYPDVYLYGALTNAAPFLAEDDRVAMWAEFLTTAIADLLASDPLPNDRSWLRMDSGLVFRPNSTTTFNIVTGDFSNGP